MRVREFMTTDVITVNSRTSIVDARKLMVTHKVRRLPVIDSGRLVGIVSFRRISEAGPPIAAASMSVWEINHLLGKMTVRHYMHKNPMTVTPDTNAETALALAQEHKVGALPVVDDGKLVGIVTTNDFVYRIMNPLLGLGRPGVRLHIFDCGETLKIQEAITAVAENNLSIVAIHVDESTERKKRDLIIQVDTKKPNSLIENLTNRGFKVEIRERKSWPV